MRAAELNGCNIQGWGKTAATACSTDINIYYWELFTKLQGFWQMHIQTCHKYICKLVNGFWEFSSHLDTCYTIFTVIYLGVGGLGPGL